MAGKRFPGKPLADVGGHPLLWHAWRTAVTWPRAASVVVASPDDAILEAAGGFGAVTQHSPPDCHCGSQRAFGVYLRNPKYAVLVNLQCDEPGVTHAMLDAIAEEVHPSGVLLGGKGLVGSSIATVAAPFIDGIVSPDPNVVKVICDVSGRAIYFTRQPIPNAWHHVGVYAFRGRIVETLSQTPRSSCGEVECLEQLDWLVHWIYRDIRVVLIEKPTLAVNTPGDLERVRARLAEANNA